MDTRDQFLHDMLGKTVQVKVDRPIGHCHKGMVYPVNYGFIPGIMAADNEEQDAYILGVTEPLETFEGQVVGAVRRINDWEDKLIVAPEGMVFHQGQIAASVHFQEQYFDTYIISAFRKSCGVLPWRKVGAEKEFLIVYETFSQCWSLPKGHMESGETEEMTALRELREETGLTGKLDVTRSASVEYPISPIAKKQVVFFLGEVFGEPRTRIGEIEHFKWVKAEELKDYLYPDTVAAIQKLFL